ncbi:MAG: NAD(P)-dependent oxidoreductase [Anaerolineae bacterium]|nr:NAD(P)-dependent oxidoreductase [Anaerolineae bacterium]
MNILVTGVSGLLGSHLAKTLAACGHTVRGASHTPADIPGVECIAADMSDYDTCIELGAGMDAIAHVGAYHGIHLPRTNPPNPKTEREFFDANLAGTFYLFQSAVEHDIPKVVWASSAVVYERDHWTQFGIYSFTKAMGEDICRFFNREHHISVIGLRYGAFSFPDFAMRGFNMLGGWNCLELEEAVNAAVLAVENETIDFGIYDVQTPLPFTPEERWAYRFGDKPAVLAQRWPEYAHLFQKYAHLLPPVIDTVDMRHTIAELGLQFERDFEWFLEELDRREAGGG